jgi:membrane-associated phospholipid phosphatase
MRFLVYNEKNSGFAFTDPILSLFNPIDVTWLTFGLVYVGLFTALISLSFHPEYLLIAIQSYSLMFLFRLSTIYLLPLDAPISTIALTDPVVQFFGDGETLFRDLFFSGHTATMFLFYLTSFSKRLKIVFLLCTFCVAICLLIQHVHYTVDVAAAPFFAYTSYRIAFLLNNKLTK